MSRIREWWQKQTDTQRKTVKILAALAVGRAVCPATGVPGRRLGPA